MVGGHFDVHIPDQARDQIGKLVQAFNKLGNNLSKPVPGTCLKKGKTIGP